MDVKSNDKAVLVVIKDQGQGFKKEELDQIFEKNRVFSSKPTGGETSSRFGLYIVKKYIDQMNGSVEVKSEEGKGATFFVKFLREYANPN